MKNGVHPHKNFSIDFLPMEDIQNIIRICFGRAQPAVAEPLLSHLAYIFTVRLSTPLLD